MRPPGIAALEGKIVQQAVVTVLHAIYETDFMGFSYGFRAGRSQHQALDALCVAIYTKAVNWILDAEFRSFFEQIDHEWMTRFLGHRIADLRILRLIRNWLKAGVIDEHVERVPAKRGSPQGAVISPLLANIYLHYVHDLWAHQWRKRNARGQVVLVRYADDSLYGFQDEWEARRFLTDLKERLACFGLELHPEKTRLIEFGHFAASNRKRKGLGKSEPFDFLGFTHVCGKTRKGRFSVVRLTIKKRMRVTLATIRTRLRDMRHTPISEQGKWLRRVIQGYFNYPAVPGNLKRLDGFRAEVPRARRQSLMRHLPLREQVINLNRVLRGHYAYYGIAGNFRALQKVQRFVEWYWRRMLSSRSRKGHIAWEVFHRIKARFTLQRPKLYLPYRELHAIAVL